MSSSFTPAETPEQNSTTGKSAPKSELSSLQEQVSFFTKQKQAVAKQLRSLVKRADKRVQQRQLTLDECQQWQQIHHQGVMLQSQLFRLHKGMEKVTVEDWENGGTPRTIPLDPILPPHLQAETLFKRSRKLRRGIPHAERMLQQAQQESAQRHEQLTGLDNTSSPEELQAFCLQHHLSTAPSSPKKAAIHKKSQPTKPYHTYELANGFYAWIGKSAKDNDKLSFQYANGSDWWLHIRDYPGSHVVVRYNKNQSLSGEALKDAAELAMRFSKAKGIKAGEVALTQAKYLKRVKGIPGKVQLSKHKAIHHIMDEQRWLRLKNSKLVQ